MAGVVRHGGSRSGVRRRHSLPRPTGAVFVCPSGTVGALVRHHAQVGRRLRPGASLPVSSPERRACRRDCPSPRAAPSVGLRPPPERTTSALELQATENRLPGCGSLVRLQRRARARHSRSVDRRGSSGSSRRSPRRRRTVGAAVLDLTLEAQLDDGLEPSDGLGTRARSTWSVVAGRSFRPALARRRTGVISGTPTTEGAFRSDVQGRAYRWARRTPRRTRIDVRQPLKVTAREAVRDGAPPDVVGGRSSLQRQAHALRREWDVHVHARSGIAADGAGARRRRDGRRNSTRCGGLSVPRCDWPTARVARPTTPRTSASPRGSR